jgi:hypothetical protein
MGRHQKHNLDDLADEIIEWSQHATSLNLIGFSSPKRMSVTKLPEYANKHKKFREALQLAKENISQNRFDAACAEVMPEKFYSRCEGQYDPLYHKYDREERKYDADIKAKAEGNNRNQKIIVKVKNDLARGVNVRAKKLSNSNNRGSK